MKIKLKIKLVILYQHSLVNPLVEITRMKIQNHPQEVESKKMSDTFDRMEKSHLLRDHNQVGQGKVGQVV